MVLTAHHFLLSLALKTAVSTNATLGAIGSRATAITQGKGKRREPKEGRQAQGRK